jgi:nitrogen fixation NifU-like protein
MPQYSEKVMDHFSHPRNVGEMPDANGIGTVGNPVCGDVMKMYIKVEGDIITDVRFQTFGCGAAIATSSISTELIKGKSISEALTLTNKAVAEALDGLPPMKMHCSLLAEEAVRSAIDDYLKKTTGKGLEEGVGKCVDPACCGCGHGHGDSITSSIAGK